MNLLPRLLAALGAAFALTACATVSPPPPAPLTILVSIDGFRSDYLDRGVTPTLSGLAAHGARGTMRPSFPSKTFPNHYALVTGLRPDRSGIVDNTIYDPAIPGVKFTMADKATTGDARWWNQATPIWVTAERAGVRSAIMFWPGSDAPIQGVRPSRWLPFNQALPAVARVDQVLAWLDVPPDQRPRFATLYFDEVDTAGHDFGPDSAEVNAAAARTDAAIARLVAGLKARGIVANLVVVADHGMAPTPPDQTIFVDDLVPTDAIRTVTMGAFMSLSAVPGREAQVEAALLKPHPRMQCWRKADIPARFHYGKNPRVPPYFCLPQTGWTITTHRFKPKKPEVGNHGFDPYAPEMAAVFVANGPAFRPGARPPVFDNVDVYPLVARLIGVKPEPSDGRLADLAGVLAR
ncbi:alkaline phosphatase family protein [Phenylobacterium hankyongense]|uniref:Alkaline phosphatase family protein n=1 Tax=Phenylobacterium hankyongense TaxID=1813876 RepID=A0A328B6M7_9CAUL|nr:ectonucleotide pyrophosphatase/phosphodiesterase [Phenylobacterium hankyongense]RAK61586.1 alkaline phosphatase family protein [Phenylobacterium hankyongense]